MIDWNTPAAAMMKMSMGPMIGGWAVANLLLLISGVFYLVCAFFLWKPYRQEKNELVGALFAFLVYQAINMFFMGLSMQYMNISLSYVATLAVFLGSAYMLKFPLSRFSQGTRRILFYLSIVILLGLFAWFMQTPDRQMALMNFTLWYDIVINGIIVGGSIILYGLGAKERYLKIKSLGGGSGVITCCIVSNAAMLGGAIITGTALSFLAPILILTTLAAGRRPNY